MTKIYRIRLTELRKLLKEGLPKRMISTLNSAIKEPVFRRSYPEL
jgi:hypothetical protein